MHTIHARLDTLSLFKRSYPVPLDEKKAPEKMSRTSRQHQGIVSRNVGRCRAKPFQGNKEKTMLLFMNVIFFSERILDLLRFWKKNSENKTDVVVGDIITSCNKFCNRLQLSTGESLVAIHTFLGK